MHIENLVKMANQIGSFFESVPDRQQAEKDVAQHLKRFWEPRMRKALIEHVENGGADLSPFVLHSVATHKSSLV